MLLKAHSEAVKWNTLSAAVLSVERTRTYNLIRTSGQRPDVSVKYFFVLRTPCK